MNTETYLRDMGLTENEVGSLTKRERRTLTALVDHISWMDGEFVRRSVNLYLDVIMQQKARKN